MVVVFELIYMVFFVYDDVIDDVDKWCGKLIIKVKWDNCIVMYIGDYIFVCVFEVMSEVKDVEVYKILFNMMVELMFGEIE